jgi:hypothetical protein
MSLAALGSFANLQAGAANAAAAAPSLPMSQRFLPPDPIGFHGARNLYSYAGNGPLNPGDTTGLTTGEPAIQTTPPITTPFPDPLSLGPSLLPWAAPNASLPFSPAAEQGTPGAAGTLVATEGFDPADVVLTGGQYNPRRVFQLQQAVDRFFHEGPVPRQSTLPLEATPARPPELPTSPLPPTPSAGPPPGTSLPPPSSPTSGASPPPPPEQAPPRPLSAPSKPGSVIQPSQDPDGCGGSTPNQLKENFLKEFFRRIGPGPFAPPNGGVPLARPYGRARSAERAQNDANGAKYGCHTCGTKNFGTPSGNPILDHQPSQSINPPPGAPTQGYPHCVECSSEQGTLIWRVLRALGLL